jgi:hypothetical protein
MGRAGQAQHKTSKIFPGSPIANKQKNTLKRMFFHLLPGQANQDFAAYIEISSNIFRRLRRRKPGSLILWLAAFFDNFPDGFAIEDPRQNRDKFLASFAY